MTAFASLTCTSSRGRGVASTRAGSGPYERLLYTLYLNPSGVASPIQKLLSLLEKNPMSVLPSPLKSPCSHRVMSLNAGVRENTRKMIFPSPVSPRIHSPVSLWKMRKSENPSPLKSPEKRSLPASESSRGAKSSLSLGLNSLYNFHFNSKPDPRPSSP